jgi:hypothetical protein
MKKIIRIIIYNLLITSLFLASCSNMAANPSEAPQAAAGEAPVRQQAVEQNLRGALPSEVQTSLLAPGVQFTLGFSPDADAFSFENYANTPEITNLTSIEIRRMFGDSVCARFTPEEEPGCILIPPANRFMQEMNALMDNGHCEGLAVLSLFFHSGLLDPITFGAPITAELVLEGNQSLQREIAYWFATQVTSPAADHIIRTTPNKTLAILAAAFDQETHETYTLGIYRQDMTNGHAVTPYAIDWQEEDIFWLWVYDNNDPDSKRHIEFDLSLNAWTYTDPMNPGKTGEIYSGDASTLNMDLTPGSTRTGLQVCTFCDSYDPDQKPIKSDDAGSLPKNQIWVEGSSLALIENEVGQRFGFEEGRFINEIPQSTSTSLKFANSPNHLNPIYNLPVGMGYSLSFSESQKTTKPESPASVVMIGQGFYIGIENLSSNPSDLISVSQDGLSLSYLSSEESQPTIVFGMDDEPVDYEMTVGTAHMSPGSEISLTFQRDKGWLTMHTTDLDGENLGVEITCIFRYGVVTFHGEDITLNPGDLVHFDITNWWRFGYGDMQVHIDHGGDGSIDQTLEFSNAE